MPNEAKFTECDTCRAKPGTPLLCGGCYTNRELIMSLEARNAKLREACEATLNRLTKEHDGFGFAPSVCAICKLIELLRAALGEGERE